MTPQTPTGKRLHERLCDAPMPHGCWHQVGIERIEAEAKAQERERLRAAIGGLRLGVTPRAVMEPAFRAGWAKAKEEVALLAEETP